MRIVFSVLALLLVAAVVMKLAATQTRALVPAASGTASAAAALPQAADQVIKALEQGAAQRAAEAASQ
jgi:hypothetical protein